MSCSRFPWMLRFISWILSCVSASILAATPSREPMCCKQKRFRWSLVTSRKKELVTHLILEFLELLLTLLLVPFNLLLGFILGLFQTTLLSWGRQEMEEKKKHDKSPSHTQKGRKKKLLVPRLKHKFQRISYVFLLRQPFLLPAFPRPTIVGFLDFGWPFFLECFKQGVSRNLKSKSSTDE